MDTQPCSTYAFSALKVTNTPAVSLTCWHASSTCEYSYSRTVAVVIELANLQADADTHLITRWRAHSRAGHPETTYHPLRLTYACCFYDSVFTYHSNAMLWVPESMSHIHMHTLTSLTIRSVSVGSAAKPRMRSTVQIRILIDSKVT